MRKFFLHFAGLFVMILFCFALSVSVVRAEDCASEFNICSGICGTPPDQTCTESCAAAKAACQDSSAASGGSASAGSSKSGKYGLQQTASASSLPNTDKNLPTLIGLIIKAALGLVATIFFGLMVYGGFQWMVSAGNSEGVGAAKKLIINAVLGLVVISAAYAITTFVITNIG